MSWGGGSWIDAWKVVDERTLGDELEDEKHADRRKAACLQDEL